MEMTATVTTTMMIIRVSKSAKKKKDLSELETV